MHIFLLIHYPHISILMMSLLYLFIFHCHLICLVIITKIHISLQAVSAITVDAPADSPPSVSDTSFPGHSIRTPERSNGKSNVVGGVVPISVEQQRQADLDEFHGMDADPVTASSLSPSSSGVRTPTITSCEVVRPRGLETVRASPRPYIVVAYLDANAVTSPSPGVGAVDGVVAMGRDVYS